jgi:hypothetical protein
MPAKGTRKLKPKGKRSETQMALPNELYDEIERLAVVHDLINPRNGKGNRTKLIEVAVRAFKLFCRQYNMDSMPYPQKLADYLIRKANKGDEEAQVHLDYLESWSTERSYEEVLAESTVKIRNSYIV